MVYFHVLYHESASLGIQMADRQCLRLPPNPHRKFSSLAFYELPFLIINEKPPGLSLLTMYKTFMSANYCCFDLPLSQISYLHV